MREIQVEIDMTYFKAWQMKEKWVSTGKGGRDSARSITPHVEKVMKGEKGENDDGVEW